MHLIECGTSENRGRVIDNGHSSFSVGSYDGLKATGWIAVGFIENSLSENILSRVLIMLSSSCKFMSGVKTCKKAHLSSAGLITDDNWH